MRKSRYMLIDAEHSVCPTCHQRLVILWTDADKKPKFYICWSCHQVSQVGIGPVADKRTSSS